MSTEHLTMLPTTVIGSYAVPEWLGQLRNDYYQRRISEATLAEIQDMVTKAALVDQEHAGIDIISDGELRRDNDIDYLLARIPGIEISRRDKADYFDYYDARVTRPLPDPADEGLGLAADFRFIAGLTDKPVKVSLTGPFSLSRRIRNTAYRDPGDLVRGLARVLGAEAGLLARAGARLLQIDEPFLAGYPEAVGLAVEALNIVTADADVNWTLHVCYGNRYARPLWAGHYDFLFPAVSDARIDRLALEFARTGDEDLHLLEQHEWHRGLGLGVIDVKSNQVESPDLVAARIRRALKVIAPDRLVINPDCGLRHLPPAVARAKLAAMVEGAALVRAELADPGPGSIDAVRIDLASTGSPRDEAATGAGAVPAADGANDRVTAKGAST
jgi:5-methyltetrahydropteroyltriglutamate--homocysteine methyltransferase